MHTKLLDDIVGSIAGKPAVDIVNILYGKKNVNEFLIAKKIKMTINQTRKVLYKLSDFGLVSFTRKKDKRKGWYTYFWTLNLDKIYELMEKILYKELDNLRNQLKSRKEKRFYICKTCDKDVSEETALLNNFSCSECGQVYELNTDPKIIKELESKINKFEKEQEAVKSELEELRKAHKKKAEKEEKKLKKAKKKARKKTKKKKKVHKKKAKKKRKKKKKKKT